MSRYLPIRYIALLLALTPAVASAQGVGGIAVRAFGAREWREAVAAVVNLPTCDTGSGISSENGVLRYVVAEEALYRCTGGAWGVALAGGGGADTTCLDAGVDCLFAASATEGGAATSALDLSCTGCVAASEVAADVATQAELDAVDTTADDLSDDSITALSDVTAISGNTTTIATTSGALTSGNCVEIDASGNLVDAGAGCGGGAVAFSGLTSGTNTSAAMVCGAGCSLKIAGTGTIDASGIDADGDGTRELRSAGGEINFHPNDSAGALFRMGAGPGSTDQYLELIASGGFSILRTGTGLAGLVLRSQGSNKPVNIDATGHVALRTGAAYATESYRCDTGTCTTKVNRADLPSFATCADSGNASPGTLLITPATSYVEVTNSDADGCTVTIGEPTAGGQRLTLALVATAGGVLTLSDAAGSVNLSADWTPGAGDTLTMTYSLTRSEWLETARSDN